MRKKKKGWTGWFRPLQRPIAVGPLFFSKIEIREDKKCDPPIIITVPAACGTAVKRNRFRRMMRGFFLRNRPPFPIWLRLSDRCRLGNRIRLEDYKEKIVEGLRRVS